MLQNLLNVERPDYGKNIFKGVVVDNNDPLKLERIKVQIIGLYEGTDLTLYPWCISFNRMFFGSGTGYGTFGVPRVGSVIAVMLQQGDPHFPVYLGAVLQKGNEIAEAGVNYPNRYGWKDAAGNYWYTDQTTGQVVIKLHHKSGTDIQINDNGSVVITTASNVNVTVNGNVTAQVNGTLAANITGNATIISGATATIQAVNAIIQATTIKLQNAGTQLKKLVNDAFIQLFNTHTHPGVESGPSSTGAPNEQMGASHTTSVTESE